MGFRTDLVGCVNAHFATQAGFGTGEVKVIDGCVFNQHGIPYGISTGRNSPDHFTPVPYVNIIISDDNGLGISKLPQPGPDAKHDPARMAWIVFTDTDNRNAV